MRVVKDRASGDAELLFAFGVHALIQMTNGNGKQHRLIRFRPSDHFAARGSLRVRYPPFVLNFEMRSEPQYSAPDAIRPAQRFEVILAGFFGRELLRDVYQALACVASH